MDREPSAEADAPARVYFSWPASIERLAADFDRFAAEAVAAERARCVAILHDEGWLGRTEQRIAHPDLFENVELAKSRAPVGEDAVAVMAEAGAAAVEWSDDLHFISTPEGEAVAKICGHHAILHLDIESLDELHGFVQEQIAAAVLVEREACAKIAEATSSGWYGSRCATAIRTQSYPEQEKG